MQIKLKVVIINWNKKNWSKSNEKRIVDCKRKII